MASWYDADPNAALGWALNLGNPTDEGVMMSVIVDRCAQNDWKAAVALAEQHGAAAGRPIFMPRRLSLEVMRTLNPEERVIAFENNRNNALLRNYYEEPLTRLGYSPEEIDRILPE